MFANKKTILFITKSKITVSEVIIGNSPTEKIISQFDWTTNTLDNVLLGIKRQTNKSIRILLSEDFVYVVSVSLAARSIVNKELILQKAQELIPENLRETAWDFKEILQIPFLNKLPTITIQVVAVVRTLFEALSKSVTNAGLSVEAIEPLSYALARFTKNQDQPFLFVYFDEEILLTLVQKEIVLATERLNHIDTTFINQFIAFAKEKFLIEPKNIIFCGNTKSLDLKQYDDLNLKVEIQNISPTISLAYKEDLKGKDEDVLNLGLLKMLHKDADKQVKSINKTPVQNKGFPYKVIVAIGFVVTIGLVGGLIVYKNISSKRPDVSKENKFTLSPASTLTLSPKPSVEQSSEIDKSAYTISILNGSGIAGRATELKNLLKENGFNVVKTGNAETLDYEKTQVRFKEKVPNEAKLALDKLLKSVYDLYIDKKLEEKEDTDILIIIGKSIKNK